MRLRRHKSGCDNSGACAWCGHEFAHYGQGDTRNEAHYQDLESGSVTVSYDYYCVPCAELFLRAPTDVGDTLRALRG